MAKRVRCTTDRKIAAAFGAAARAAEEDFTIVCWECPGLQLVDACSEEIWREESCRGVAIINLGLHYQDVPQ